MLSQLITSIDDTPQSQVPAAMVHQLKTWHTVTMSQRGFSAPTITKQKEPTASQKGRPSAQTPSWRLLPESYALFRRNYIPASIVIIVPPLLVQLSSTLPQVAGRAGLWIGASLGVLGTILTLASMSASILLQIQIVRGQRVRLPNLYRDSFRYWLRLLGFSLLFGLILVVGLILLIVPGVIALRRYILTPYFLVEEDLGIRRAMQRSAAASLLVRKHIWTMLAIVLSFGGLGAICTKLSPEYGGFISVILPIVYGFLPALRYKEAASNLAVTTVKD